MAAPKFELAKLLKGEIAEKKARLAEIEQLMNERTRLMGDIAALEHTMTILAREPGSQTPLVLGSSGPPPEITHFSELGLSEAIRFVLRPAPPEGMRPIEVTRELKARGYTTSGRVPIDARVAAEISRMRRAGHLTRNDEGRYRLSGG